MSIRGFSSFAVLLVAGLLFLAACGTDEVADVEEVADEPVDQPDEDLGEEPADEPTDADADGPTELNIAALFVSPVEEPWGTAFLQAFDRVAAEEPHGLTLSLDYSENVAIPDAERVIRDYASSGDYGIIWAHTSYWEAVQAVRDDFPDTLFVYTGAGNEPLGGNAYWFEMTVHEAAYLAGIVAGSMTETNLLGGVAAFPFENVNAPLNAFRDGARSVNPDVDIVVTYIESWFDPPTARESAAAQIAAGADMIYAERLGPFEAVTEADGVYAFGHFTDQNDLAPDVVVTSPTARWDPSLHTAIDAWWAHATEGQPYDAPDEFVRFSMAEGAAALAPFHGLEDVVPDEAKEAVAEAEEAIMSGELEIPFDPAPLE